MPEDFRVEVELDDEAHGYSLRERLRALDLDDQARERLGRNAVVTRDGSRLFVYTSTESQVREAERIVRSLLDEEKLSADISVTRWHPVEEDWKDASLPVPGTLEEERAEYEAREATETQKAELEGDYDWQVVIHLPGREDAAALAQRLSNDGLPVAHRWRYVVVGAVTEERAEEFASRLRAKLAGGTEVTVEANISDIAVGTFQFIGF